ncbi:MAG: glycine-rich domain-containing protein [Phycisphaerales bacterium]
MTTWPTSAGFTTNNVDNPNDSPAAARSDIDTLMDNVTDMIGARGAANGVAGLDSGGKVPIGQLPDAVSSAGGSVEKGIATWGVPGVYLWTVPANVYRLKRESVGAGGGGSNGYTGAGPNAPGWGGGAGGYAIDIIAVTPGDTVTITVAAGGVGGSGFSTAACAGGNGGNSSITVNGSTLVGNGGQGGQQPAAAAGAGGAFSGPAMQARHGNPGFGSFGGTNEYSGWNPSGSSYGGGGGWGVSGAGTAYAGLNGFCKISY